MPLPSEVKQDRADGCICDKLPRLPTDGCSPDGRNGQLWRHSQRIAEFLAAGASLSKLLVQRLDERGSALQ